MSRSSAPMRPLEERVWRGAGAEDAVESVFRLLRALGVKLHAEGFDGSGVGPAQALCQPGEASPSPQHRRRQARDPGRPRAHRLAGTRKPESTDRSLTGRAAGLAESSAGVAALARRCRGRAGARSRRSARLGVLSARARGCARRARACWREPRTRTGAVSGRQAGSGSARNRASAAAHWPAQGQRFGRCRVQRRAEWVSRPARAK